MDLVILSHARSLTNDHEVHKAGCAHLSRHPHADPWEIDAASEQEVVDAMYGPDAGSFYQEAAHQDRETGEWIDATWRDYVQAFHFAPCADLPATPAGAPAAEVLTRRMVDFLLAATDNALMWGSVSAVTAVDGKSLDPELRVAPHRRLGVDCAQVAIQDTYVTVYVMTDLALRDEEVSA